MEEMVSGIGDETDARDARLRSPPRTLSPPSACTKTNYQSAGNALQRNSSLPIPPRIQEPEAFTPRVELVAFTSSGDEWNRRILFTGKLITALMRACRGCIMPVMCGGLALERSGSDSSD